MKTIEQILEEVSKAGKQCSRRQLFRYFGAVTPPIKPVGSRQRPQLYPDDAPIRIKVHLGLSGDVATLTMRQLKDVKRRSLTAKAKLIRSRN